MQLGTYTVCVCVCLMNLAHIGVHGVHLQEVKIHGQLTKHYWWPQMCTDITACCHKCEVCVSHIVGHARLPTNEIVNDTVSCKMMKLDDYACGYSMGLVCIVIMMSYYSLM